MQEEYIGNTVNTSVGKIQKRTDVISLPDIEISSSMEDAILSVQELYQADMSDYSTTHYTEDGTLNEDVAIFQERIVDTGNVSILDDYVGHVISRDDPEILLKFMNTYLDPQILLFDGILVDIYSYIWELVLISDAVDCAIMLMSKNIYMGFSGDPTFFSGFYHTFWSYNSDTIIDIMFIIYPSDQFFFYCSNYLTEMSPDKVNIRRFYEYIDYFNDPVIYTGGSEFKSIYDIACYFREIYPEVFEDLRKLGIPYDGQEISFKRSKWLHELPYNKNKYDEITEYNTIRGIL